jgi:hypothetical protein
MKAGLYFKPRNSFNFYSFEASHIIWAAERMKVEHEDYLGNGTEEDPFHMCTIGQWAKAAADVTTRNAYLYRIGRHLIERVPAIGEDQKRTRMRTT